MTTEIDDHVLTTRRTFDAPRDDVFAAFTDPDQLELWWGPEGYTTVTYELDLRRGGVWHYCLRAASEAVGADSCVKSWYQDVVIPERLHYRDTFVDGEGEQIAESPEFLVRIVFREVGDQTEVDMVTDFASSDQLQTVVAMGMIEGFTESFVRLDAALASRRTR